jgi:hypothetical protein
MDPTYVLIWAVFSVVGALIGSPKKRVGAGAFWGFLLGPIGWLIVLLGPDYSKPKDLSGNAGNTVGTTQLLELKVLLEKGVITQQEFDDKKQQLLSKI